HARFSRDWSSDVCSSDLRARRSCPHTRPHRPDATALRARSSRMNLSFPGSWQQLRPYAEYAPLIDLCIQSRHVTRSMELKLAVRSAEPPVGKRGRCYVAT